VCARVCVAWETRSGLNVLRSALDVLSYCVHGRTCVRVVALCACFRPLAGVSGQGLEGLTREGVRARCAVRVVCG
jgi:hypothetical protein